jgi:hypothetical protein
MIRRGVLGNQGFRDCQWGGYNNLRFNSIAWKLLYTLNVLQGCGSAGLKLSLNSNRDK